jgi:thiopeptide-type bacteriocin biosynthesis protein
VVVGRVVLSLACWRMNKEEIRHLSSTQGTARFQAMQQWRAERRLPRWITLDDADNVLPIDLDNALCIDALVHLVKQREEATLAELFPGPEQLCARGPEGRFVHELIVPFVRRSDTASVPRAAGDRESHSRCFPAQSSSRRFAPGSEWLYAKLYTGTAVADRVLREVVRPLTEELLECGAAQSWFFIRYGDPDWHLRLRFQGAPERLHADVLPALQAAVNPLLGDGRLWRMQLDTYEREVERYGGTEGIELSERLFHADSESVLEIIELLEPGDAGLDERWRLVLLGIDCLLEDFGFDLEAKQALIEEVRERFAKEFRVDQQVTGQLAGRFRKERKGLEVLLDPAQRSESPLLPGIEILRRRSLRWAPAISEIKSCAQAGRLLVSLGELAASHAHMHANRLLRSAQRAQEMVIYDLLSCLYEAQLARASAARRTIAHSVEKLGSHSQVRAM